MSTATKGRKAAAQPVEDDYLKLVREFPLRPIRGHREYNEAVKIVDRLAVQDEAALTPGERDYLDTLTLLVQAYDDEHFKIKTAHLKPLDVLKYLMDQTGMTTGDLSRLLGNSALGSVITKGQRALSKAHIRILANHFKVDPSLFLMAE